MPMSDGHQSVISAASDTQAMGVADVALRLDVDMLGALSLIGYDDVGMSGCAGPTTARQPLLRVGSRADEVPIDTSAASGRGAVTSLPLELVVRETSRSL